MRDQDNLRRLRREWYHRNRSVEAEKQRLRRLARRAEVQNFPVSLKESTPCSDCGNTYPSYVMDFDHLENKTFNISGHNGSKSMATVLKEMEKCEIVCSNCHRIRTYLRTHMDVV